VKRNSDHVAQEGGVHDLYAIAERIRYFHTFCGNSWRTIASMEEFGGVSAPAIRRIAQGEEPGNRIRAKLGLPAVSTVVIIGGGSVPAGAQVIYANECECGQWYISNHPRRKKCFMCRPYRARKETR